MPGSFDAVSSSPSPVEKTNVQLVKLAAPSVQELRHNKELLSDWYKTAENAMMYKDASLLQSTVKRIEEVSLQLSKTYAKFLDWLCSGPKYEEYRQEMQSAINCKLEMMGRIEQWKKRFEEQHDDPHIIEARSEERCSSRLSKQSGNTSRTYSSTSSSVKRLEAKARYERARVGLAYAEEQEKLEAERLKLEAEKRKLKARQELHEAEAEVKVWETASQCSVNITPHKEENLNLVNGIREEPKIPIPSNLPATPPILVASSPCHTREDQGGMDQETSAVVRGIMSAVGDVVNSPKPDFVKFSGNPMDYWQFVRNFEAVIERKSPSDRLKLQYLWQHCTGKARSLIDHCNILPPQDGYNTAREILYDNFGKPHIIAREFVRQLTSGPNLKPDDSTGLKEFAQLMRKCLLILDKLGNFSDLNTTDRLVELVLKLPYNSQNMWKRRAASILKETGEDATFRHLVDFVEEEAEVANTIFSKLLVPRKREERKQQDKQPKKTSVHTVVTRVDKSQAQPDKERMKCPLCKGSHVLEDCEALKKKTIQERVSWLRDKRLCFNCLNPGHVAKHCKESTTCGVQGCNRKHHTLLHLPQRISSRSFEAAPRASENSVAGPSNVCCTTATRRNSSYMSVVPVKFVANGKEVESYAFLDIGSDATFCHTKLVEKLGLSGKQKRIQVDTLGRRPKILDGIGVDLQVISMDGNEVIDIEEAMSVDHIPVCPYSYPTEEELEALPHLKGLEMPRIESKEIMLLIGTDTPYAHRTLEIRTGGKKEPFAARTPLGWSLIGPSPDKRYAQANRIKTCELDHEVQESWYKDFRRDPEDLPFPTSKEDRIVLKMMSTEIEHSSGHYYLPLPWRSSVKLPGDNYLQAEKRLEYLKKRLARDDSLHSKYTERIQEYIDKGYARELKNEDTSTPLWYLPHHPVYHPQKPDKVRVVFDCAAKYKGVSLNDAIMQGPDLVNSLVSVLTRFRKGPIAMVGDVEAMFHQVRVKEEDTNSLRFLWWPHGNLDKRPVVHQMLVHIFGATSSPCCATFCMKHTVEDFGHEFDKHVCDIVKNNFYVDDCLASAPTEEDAVNTIQQLCKLLHKGGFHLTKWVSNSQAVLAQIPEQERAKSVKELISNETVKQSVLGVFWNVFEDSFGFRISSAEVGGVLSRRKLLSIINSLYDPLGFAAPVILVAKRIQQEVIQMKLGWDDPIPVTLSEKWKEWYSQLPELKKLSLPRCFTPKSFGKTKNVQIHHFCDASVNGYGTVAYLREESEDHKVHCSFLCGKSRVTPPRSESIPRLELVAAVLSVKADEWLQRHLDIPGCVSVFWTDSNAVLFSIRNERKRFSTFVANRLAKIHRQTVPSQWRHVRTKYNPADDASRGISVKKLLSASEWLKGPHFLWKDERFWPTEPGCKEDVPAEFQPMEKKKALVCSASTDPVDALIERFSSFYRLKRAVAWLLRYKKFLQCKKNVSTGQLSVEEVGTAEEEVAKFVQRSTFPSAIKLLSSSSCDPRADRFVRRGLKRNDHTKCLNKLNPQLINGLLRLGGRLDNAPIPFESKHPIILPCAHHLTKLVIMNYHQEAAHAGSAHTWSLIRQKYWIVKGGAAVRSVLSSCAICRKRSAPRGQQLMADLPPARLKPGEPPFSYVGTDFFGPFLVKRGRSEVKRYGCIFTCMTMRAVHIEVAEDLSTDAFINALRRFMGRRGKPIEMYSDNGTNFVGAERVLREAIQDLNKRRLESYLIQKGIKWSFNPPAASHMGGAWERMIRSIRKILNAMLYKEPIVSEDVLHTLMVEVESIINSRPLTPVTFTPDNEVPLTPNHILLQRPSPVMSPGAFDEKDNYSRRRWRQVQFLADEFWRRWSKEYLPTIALRQKWPDRRRNFEVGDIVLVVNESIPRRGWGLGRVINTYPDKHGAVRQVDVKTQSSIIKRPIAKLCLVAEANNTVA